jgi:integrase
MKVATTALRSFFRFLLVTERGDVRLVRAVPRIPLWKLASIPRVLTDEQVRAVLASFDRSTSTGLRGHAMVTCLAALGLRACEVVALRIEDFDWRARTITVPATKTRREDVLPLPGAVVRAVLAYLRRGRPTSCSRHVFVRHVAPVGTAAGPSIVRRAVREACARAGLDQRFAGPHVFRHTFASRLLRAGATVKEGADVLRHRSIDTVAIYAKVDLPALRLVALSWPGGRP